MSFAVTRAALVLRSQRHSTDAVRVDVRTTTVHLSRPAAVAVLAPDDSGYLAQLTDSSGDALERVGWDGTVSTLSDRYSGPLLRGPDDTILVGGGAYDHTLRTLDHATGRVVHAARLPGACSPLRWWDAADVLVACARNVTLVDPATGATRVLVPERGRGDDGHLDVRRLASGPYVQVAGACGTTFVDHQDPDGTLQQVRVPGAVANVVMVATTGQRLVIQHEVDCGGDRPRPELSVFDPVTQHEQPLVVLEPDDLLGRVLAFGEVDAVQL